MVEGEKDKTHLFKSTLTPSATEDDHESVDDVDDDDDDVGRKLDKTHEK